MNTSLSPKLAEHITQCHAKNIHLIKEQSGEANLKCYEKNTSHTIHHEDSPSEEAKQWFNELKLKNTVLSVTP